MSSARRVLVALGLVALLAVPVGSAGAAAPPDPMDAAAVDRLVRDYVDRTGVPGVAVTVTRGDRVVYAAGHGHTADATPIRADTPVPVASLSKAMTATAVLQLVDAGRVGLDRPVAEQLPEFRTADPRSSAVTVRQLLNQTSGITDDTVPLLDDRPSDLRAAVATLHGARLGADPGAAYRYHNANYAIAARLVEVVSGRPFAQYMQDNVFRPLGMTGTSTVDTTDGMPDRARGYVRAYRFTIGVDEPRVFTQGGFGVVTTAEDMARWLAFQNRAIDSSVLSGRSLTMMQTPASGSDYAMGWWVDDGALVHTGELFTHNAMATLLPDTRTGIAVVANTGTVSGDDAAVLGTGLVALARGDGAGAGTPFTMVADPVLALLTVVAAGLAVSGVRRRDRWAARTAHRPSRRVAGLVAAVAPAVLLVLAGSVAVPVTVPAWALLTWPALVVACTVTCLASATVLVARVGAVVRGGRRVSRVVSGSAR